jgi:excisionase family DNA binding protein
MAYSTDYRRRVIVFVKEGGSKREAARLFKVSRETIYQWLECGDALSLKPAKTRRRKIDKEALKRHVRECPDALLRERAVVFKVDPSAIFYALKTLKIVKKTA